MDTAVAKQDQCEADRLLERMRDTRDQMYSIHSRLSTVANAVMGTLPEPDNTSDKPLPTSANGFMASADDIISQSNTALEEARSVLARLERFAK